MSVIGFATARFRSSDSTRNTAFAPVVGCKSQMPVTKLLVELLQIIQRRARALQYVSAFIFPKVLLKRINVAGLRHELPESGCFGVRQSFGLKSTFNERQKREFGGKPSLFNFVDDVVEILAGTLKDTLNVARITAVAPKRSFHSGVVELRHGVAASDAIPDVNRGRYFCFRSRKIISLAHFGNSRCFCAKHRTDEANAGNKTDQRFAQRVHECETRKNNQPRTEQKGKIADR